MSKQKLTREQRQQLDALDREVRERKAKILTPAQKKPPLPIPPDSPWTLELIERLHKYIEASRYFSVTYRTEHKVWGMDLVPEEYAGDFAPDGAEFYLQEYDDARPDGHLLSDCEPEDFQVFLLKPVEWQKEDPNWSEADPEVWAEHQEFVKASA